MSREAVSIFIIEITLFYEIFRGDVNDKTKQLLLVPAVIATGMMSFAGVLIETAMNVTFPTLIRQFDLTTAQVQWVTTIYLLMISIIVPLSTYLNRNFSLKNSF